MTTINAIKMLPMDEDLKTKVLSMYDFMEPELKRTVELIAWKTYFYVYNERMQFNLAQHFDEVEQGKAHFGKNFYREAVKMTNQEMAKNSADAGGAVDLAMARRAMEQIINEIQAAKKDQKVKSTIQ